MYRFQRRAPLDLTQYPEPPIDDRSGPPLSQGFLLTMISTIAAEHTKPETLERIAHVDPYAWYHGQVLQNILNEFEDQDPELPAELGKNMYYMFRDQLHSMGVRTPADLIQFLPVMWKHATRGDSGEWRSEVLGPGRARVEAEQPYNCAFEEGAVYGSLEAVDAMDVQIAHTQCMRKGAPYCVLEVQWHAE